VSKAYPEAQKMETTMSTLTRALAAAAIAGCVLTGWVSAVKAVDTPTTRDAPDLTAVRAKIKAKEFKSAITDLNGMIDKGVQHADVYNLLGFSLRKSGDLKTAYTFYKKALDFDPEHKGALEYLGELYVQTGDLPKAREHVVLLTKLCPQGCEELEDLQKALAAADKMKTN
jgi:tetratricopeptide (TPR) repeat protein